ncbi:unnamed protein product [Penicillium salamii]|nr:unnamed protein product [Penicillium salamii]CAG7958966.1 unnamed protein product [Penicillium salamii]
MDSYKGGRTQTRTVVGDNDNSLSLALPGYKGPARYFVYFIPEATMDHLTSPSPSDRPAMRQCRSSHDPEDENQMQSHPQQSSDGASTEAEAPVRTRGSLAAEFMKLLHYNDALATPTLKLLGLYFSFWESYIVKSAEKTRLEEEQRQLRGSNEWLASDSNTLLQLCNEQTLILWDRKRASQVLCNGVVSALQASDTQAYHFNRPR